MNGTDVFITEDGDRLILPCTCGNWHCGQIEFLQSQYEFGNSATFIVANVRVKGPSGLIDRLRWWWCIARREWYDVDIELSAEQLKTVADWMAKRIANQRLPE